MNFFLTSNLQIFFQLLLAIILGGVIGLEREYKKKEAGLRTYALVSLGAAFFTIVSYVTLNSSLVTASGIGITFDTSHIIGQIILGVGFLGGGLIVVRGVHVEGLTTAAGLWVAASVGVAVGSKLYLLAIFVSFLAVAILSGLRLIEEKVFEKIPPKKKNDF